MNTPIAEIVANMQEELGQPNVSTEISVAQIERQWNRALDEFNNRVGQFELRLFPVVAGQQYYKMKQIFPYISTIRGVKGVFYLTGENVYNQIVEEYLTGYACSTALELTASATYYTSGTLIASASFYTIGTLLASATYYACSTMLTSATYYACSTLLASATYYASGTLLASATYYPSATVTASATYYASGTLINPDYYDIDGVLLVSATTDTDGTMIQVPATYTYASGTLLSSATYYACSTVITPAYYDINGGSGTLYASATIADGSQIQVAAVYNMDGTLEETPASYADGTQEETAAIIADGSQVSASATYADGTQISASASYANGSQMIASSTYSDGTHLKASATYIDTNYSYWDYDIEAATSTATTINDAITISTGDQSLQIISELQTKGADPLYERDFQFIDPDQLLLLPAPVDSGFLLTLIQTDFTQATLPEIYERIVTDYAIARCQDVIGNARARLNTPQRSGDLVKYASREKSAYQMSAVGKLKFDNECASINIKRMF